MMFRPRARPDSPPLDEATAERMLDGAPVDGISDSHRRVMEILGILARPATPDELEGAAAAAAAFVTAHDAANRPVRRTRPMLALAVTTTLFALSTGTAVAATEGVLPEPVQAVAHEALGVVGISVPGITPEHADPAIQGITPADVHPVVPNGGGTAGTGELIGATPGSSTSSAGATTPGDGAKSTTPIDGTDENETKAPKADKPETEGPEADPEPKDPKPAPEPKEPKPAPEPKPDRETKADPEPKDRK